MLEAELKSELIEDSMKVFEPSEEYLDESTRNQMSGSDKKVEDFKKFVCFRVKILKNILVILILAPFLLSV